MRPPLPRGNFPIEIRFWPAVQKTDGGCWLWLGRKCPDGYGKLVHRRKVWGTHRISWLLHNGPIPDGMQVLHRCDVPACVNPAHLFLGTQIDNIRDMIAKGRADTSGLRGERHHLARVNEAQVRTIRSLACERRSFASIARQLSVSEDIVRNIVHRRTWRHVA